MDFLSESLFNLNQQAVTAGTALLALCVVVAAVAVAIVTSQLLQRRLFRSEHGHPASEKTVRSSCYFGIGLAGLLLALAIIGVPAAGGILLGGLAISLIFVAFTRSGADLLAGFGLLARRPFAVGNLIGVGDIEGVVESIRLRFMTVRTHDHARVTFPNSYMTSQPVSNWSVSRKGIRLRIPVDFPRGSDLNAVTTAMRRAAEQSDRVRRTPAPRAVVTLLGDRGIQIELWAWIDEPTKRHWTTNEIYRAVDSELRNPGAPPPQRSGGRVRSDRAASSSAPSRARAERASSSSASSRARTERASPSDTPSRTREARAASSSPAAKTREGGTRRKARPRKTETPAPESAAAPAAVSVPVVSQPAQASPAEPELPLSTVSESAPRVEEKSTEKVEAAVTAPAEEKKSEEVLTARTAPPEEKPVEKVEVASTPPPEEKPVEEVDAVSTPPPEEKPAEKVETAATTPAESMPAESSDEAETEKPARPSFGRSKRKTPRR